MFPATVEVPYGHMWKRSSGRLGSERWFCSVSMAVQEALLVDCDIEVKVSRLDSKCTVDIFNRLAILCLE